MVTAHVESLVSRPLIIYHGGCYDGFTAAWIVHRYYNGSVDLFPGKYGENPPDVEDRDVIIVDFSYPRETMIEMRSKAKTFTCLDHHKTAEENCRGIMGCVFDMERSGAGMAWDAFFGTRRPDWINAVEDRDLWRLRLPGAKAFHAYMASMPMTIENWDRIHASEFRDLVDLGNQVLRYITTYIDKAVKEARCIPIDGNLVIVLNIPYQNASETADRLLELYPGVDYAMGYFQRADGRWQYSLRSRSEFDVSEVAKKYGGGGHAQAAGFDTAMLLDELLT